MKCLYVAFWMLLGMFVFPLALADSGGIFFSGLALGNGTYSAGELISFKTTLVNNNDLAQPGVLVLVELVRESDGVVVANTSLEYDLGSMEVKEVIGEIQLPKRMISGSYRMVLTSYTSSGAVASQTYAVVGIESSSSGGVLFGEKGVHLEVPVVSQLSENVTRTVVKKLYGTVGETIKRGTNFSVVFEVVGVGGLPQDLDAKITAIPTYGGEIEFEEDLSLGTYIAGISKSFSVPVVIDTPGTYRIVVEIYSDDLFLARKEVRAVVSGASGSIVSLEVGGLLESGNTLEVGTTLVGPADKSELQGATFEVNVFDGSTKIATAVQDGLVLTTESVSISLELEVTDAEEYRVETKLAYEGKVLDEEEIVYRPVEPLVVMTSDGRIKSLNETGCFDDGVCESSEEALGDCLDCNPLSKSAEEEAAEFYGGLRSSAYLLFGVVVALVLLVIWWTKK